jgi:hypothetical protein
MKTLTLFIEHLFNHELGSNEYQFIQNKHLESRTYLDLILSGSLLKEIVFEDVIFENCTFFCLNISFFFDRLSRTQRMPLDGSRLLAEMSAWLQRLQIVG